MLSNLFKRKQDALPAVCLPMTGAAEESVLIHQDQVNYGRTSSNIEWRRPKSHKMTTGYEIGQDVIGRICGIEEFGYFVRLPNRESGLVLKSEVCWPGENIVFVRGQEVVVRVISFKPGLGLGLSIKRPRHRVCFSKFIETVDVGRVVRGVVTKKLDYGAFVRLAPGVEGLAHIREQTSQDEFDSWNIGQEVSFMITSIHYELLRIGLSNRVAGKNQDLKHD